MKSAKLVFVATAPRLALAFIALFVFAVFVSAAGCGSSGAKPTLKCIRDSDCSGALVCTQGYCVGKCTTSKDCPSNGRCINATEGSTCEPPEKTTCHYNSECTHPLICAGDLQCRSQCQTKDDCPKDQVCTSVSRLCADPTLDKNYDAVANEFKNGTTAFGAGMEAPDAATGDTADGGGGSNSDGAGARDGVVAVDGATVDVPGQPEVGIAASCPGTPLTLFGKVATGDSNPSYTSGVGVRLPTEMVIFNGFTGYDDVPVTDAGAGDGGDAGVMPPYVNRIDFQRFDLMGKAKAPAQRLARAEGQADTRTGESMQVLDATAAPTGEIALVYSAGTVAAVGIYLALLDPATIAIVQTIQLQSVGGTRYGRQAHVQWEAGQFVASWVSYVPDVSYINIARFLKDGTPSGGASSIPTDSTGQVRNVDYEQGSAAFVNNTFAIAYETAGGDVPSLSFVDNAGTFIPPTQVLPYRAAQAPLFTVVGATTKGFVGVYPGQLPQPDGGAPTSFATLATFVSPPGADAGVGTTVALPGLAAFNNQNGARASSDALGAGFVLLAPDGKANFAYFMDDGTKHLGPSQVLQQMGGATASDGVHLMNLNGSYALSLYSRAEHLTRMAVSGCPATTN